MNGDVATATALLDTRNAAISNLDALNIGLMAGAALLALVVPLELFACSYVVLGPLHYLTQLTWLGDRRWFVPRRSDALLLALPAVALALGAQLDPLLAPSWRPALVGVVVAAAIVFVVTSRWLPRLISLTAVAYVAWQWRQTPALMLVALMLPSAIHIFIFTGGFLLSGALRHRSIVGVISFVAFGSIAAGLLYAPVTTPLQPTGPMIATALEPFAAIRRELGALLGFAPHQLTNIDRFLGWAYCYHYLNWFSKTRLIGWHRVGRARLAAIAGGWLSCVALYGLDYTLGFLIVGCIGTLHVLLELPLDVRTFAALPRQLGAAFRAD